jgi:transcriptional regulator with XRE-family HTH domain
MLFKINFREKAFVSRHKHRKLTAVTEKNLGEWIRDLREGADLSLRELAKSVDVSAPFLSDVELGRRYPSDEVLGKLAKALKVPAERLKQHDHREAVSDFKKLIAGNAALGSAFRSALEDMKVGKISPAQLADAFKKAKRS